MSKALYPTAAAVIALAAGTAVFAQQSSPVSAGRYTMAPAEGGGFARLDTETGAMSLCRRKAEEWLCEPMRTSGGDAGSELDRLRKENEELRAEIKRLDELLGLGEAPGKDRPHAGRQGPPLNLPSEQEVDKALDYIERMFKKFRDRLQQLDREDPKKGTPL